LTRNHRNLKLKDSKFTEESQEFLRVYLLLKPVHAPQNPARDKRAVFAVTFSDI
jgi:hypothetical protein